MAMTTEQRISWSELRTRAQLLRERSAKAGEAGLSMRISDMLETLPLPYDPEPLPDDATDEEIAEAEREPLDFAEDVLKRHGVRCRPTPGDAGPSGVTTLRPSNRFALQGALAVGILALLAGGGVSKVAFVGFLPFVLVGVWLTWTQMHRLDRVVPRVVPRGRILGALLMIILLMISVVAAVQPGRKWMRQRGNVANAVALSVQAEAQLSVGDLVGARASVDGAMQAAPGLGQVQATAQKLMVAQISANTTATINAGFAAQATYTRAEAAYKAGNWQEAIDGMTAIGGFGDAPQRLAKIRNEAALSRMMLARRVLAAGDARRAFQLYSEGVHFDPTVDDPALIKQIDARLRPNS